MGFDPFMKVALELAKEASAADIRPNPFVGAVVVSPENEIIGKGFHQKYGKAHAEVNAIHDALSKRSDLSECTLYVTLEPCSHVGNTPPCTDLIIQHRLKKVVIGSEDADERVDGIGVLKKAGIETVLQIHQEIIDLNKVFFTNKKKYRPYISLKMAMSFDGKIKDSNGKSQWISGNASRRYVHNHLRKDADAILTTAKTVIADNASLNIRLDDETLLDKDVLVIDRNFSLLENQYRHLKLFASHPNSTILLIGDQSNKESLPFNVELFQATYTDQGLINLEKLFQELLKKGYYNILIESGSFLATKLLENDLIDELNLFLAPFALPSRDAQPLFDSALQCSIQNPQKFKPKEIFQFEDDLMISYTRC
jgi:diaminohydroxyphosphoribosylaminopyrimidine deaminase / 5-amino-6-(5-phosphoribosylamino)uracil reductase